jgi:hypothetical protein
VSARGWPGQRLLCETHLSSGARQGAGHTFAHTCTPRPAWVGAQLKAESAKHSETQRRLEEYESIVDELSKELSAANEKLVAAANTESGLRAHVEEVEGMLREAMVMIGDTEQVDNRTAAGGALDPAFHQHLHPPHPASASPRSLQEHLQASVQRLHGRDHAPETTVQSRDDTASVRHSHTAHSLEWAELRPQHLSPYHEHSQPLYHQSSPARWVS